MSRFESAKTAIAETCGVGTVTTEADNDFPVNTVMQTSPKAGATVTKGDFEQFLHDVAGM